MAEGLGPGTIGWSASRVLRGDRICRGGEIPYHTLVTRARPQGFDSWLNWLEIHISGRERVGPLAQLQNSTYSSGVCFGRLILPPRIRTRVKPGMFTISTRCER